MTPRPNRAFLSPLPDEAFEALAARALPDEEAATAIEKLKSWNLHIFAMRKPTVLLGSDVVFVEPPQRASGYGLLAATVSRGGSK